jgi:predicted HicB family RNase H-like nuclease
MTATRARPKKKDSTADERIKSIYLPESVHERIKAHADANGMSVSELVREYMEAYASGTTPPARERTTKRVTVWVNIDAYARFAKRVRTQGVTIASAIEAAMGDDA